MTKSLTYGVGVNFRSEIADELLLHSNRFDFIEVITDLLFISDRLPEVLEHLLIEKPCVLHGLKMSLGAAEPLNQEYLNKTIAAVQKWNPLWFSDHLAYTRVGNFDIDQLMPVRRNKENLKELISKIKKICKKTETPFLIENITYYFEFPNTHYLEAEFLSALTSETNCGLLLDLNNLYINACNHQFDAYDFLNKIDLSRVVEIHIAGGVIRNEMLIDSHGHSISKDVWELLKYVCDRVVPKGIVIERDANFDIDDILNSLDMAKQILYSSKSYKNKIKNNFALDNI
ncbi:DUF692 domain-containing protein [Acinetobacter oleivorans]|uniref:DUF692 domain-containing protein n=1 Tax=Acinetobacter oleivorans TaxID=1148157 RepID=UPI0018FF16DE|nr:DUF692 domain-containing protein [Acinetobacter oleivorans]MBJ9739616.1 DUF692 domain-containing protein [Acinetobacter oleivorans]MCU4411978.1 DUF692 domain-containing protein [Acinetobacter oleivorans]